MQTNQTPEALAEEARGHAVRATLHAYNRGLDDVSDDPLRAANANYHRDVQEEEAAALEACITRLRDMAVSGAKDAERYQMVRRGQRWSVINGIGDELKGEALDAAADAAIAATKRGGA